MEIDGGEWDRVMTVNVKGLWHCVKAVYPAMQQQGKGKIINISSGTMLSGSPFFLHYVSSKGAVVGFTRALAREVGNDNICVNSIMPGLTISSANQEGVMTAEQLADRIRAVQDELREAKRRLKAGAAAGGGLPGSSELAARAEDVAPGVRLVAFAGPYESVEAMKGAAKDLRGIFPSGIIAFGLEADEPTVFVTVSHDLVARGIAAGDLVREAVTAIDGRGGGRPEMAQGKGSRRDGLPAALAAIADAVRARLDAAR